MNAHLLDTSKCVLLHVPLIHSQIVKPSLLNIHVSMQCSKSNSCALNHAVQTSNVNFTNTYSSQNRKFSAIHNLVLYIVLHAVNWTCQKNINSLTQEHYCTTTTSAIHWVCTTVALLQTLWNYFLDLLVYK